LWCGADVNILDIYGRMALEKAIANNKTEIALYLVENGAKFDDRTAELIYNALYRLEAKTPLFKDFIKLRDLMIEQGVKYTPPIPDPDAE